MVRHQLWMSVGKTVIVNRKTCCGERAKNIEVRLSNDGESMYEGGLLLGKFEGPGSTGGTILRFSLRRGGNNWLGVISLYRSTMGKIFSTLMRSPLLEKLSLLLEYENIAMSSCLT